MKEEELSALNADLDLTTKQIITSLTGPSHSHSLRDPPPPPPGLPRPTPPVCAGIGFVCSIAESFGVFTVAFCAQIIHASKKRELAGTVSAARAGYAAGVVRGGAGSGQRPWAMLERVLTRTCDAWQGIHSDRKQLDRLHAETNSLGTISTTGSTPVSSSMCIAAMH